MKPIPSILEYYANHSPLTDPGEYVAMFDGLPEDPVDIAKIVQGVLIHKLTVAHYNVDISPVQRAEQYLRSVQERLKHYSQIDPKPMMVQRRPADRQVGVCRDFALLFIAMLRHKHIPARMRIGFAEYLVPNSPIKADHWIGEYWNADQERWILFDPQIDDVQREATQITCNVSDLKQDVDFFLAGKAWTMARAGKAKSTYFRFSGRWKGMPCIRGNLLHDFQALNKIELNPWDYWDDLSMRAESALTAEDKALLDRIAALTTTTDDHFDEILELFDALPRTVQIRTKLRMLGYMAEDQPDFTRIFHLQPSGFERLVELSRQTISNPPAAFPLAEAKNNHFDFSSYDLPEDSPLAALTVDSLMVNNYLGDIVVRGARQHNLQNITVRVPRHKLVVITGVSGSGKSSLAFDTIYAEGQRRYIESLSSYARQFMGQMEKPQVDQITGLSPSIAIEQKTISRNPRSTVGTVTEILDYLRVLYARLGTPHCPQCGRAVQAQTAQQIISQLTTLPAGQRFQLLAPVIKNRKGAQANLLRQALKDGYERARVDNEIINLVDRQKSLPILDKNKKHTIEIVVDRLVAPDPQDIEATQSFRLRLADSVETALRAAKGVVEVLLEDSEEIILSEHNACPVCELSFPELQPNLFSFNSPFGMCPECNGLGVVLQVDPNLIITQPNLSLLDGASPWYHDLRKKTGSRWQVKNLEAIAGHYQADLEKPWNDLPENFKHAILYGSDGEKVHFQYASEDGSWSGQAVRDVKGAVHNINRLFRQTKSEYTRRFYMQFMNRLPCSRCQGERLCPEARFVTLASKRLPELTSWSIQAIYDWVCDLPKHFNEEQHKIGDELVEEIRQRLGFIRNVGLHYLTLDRPAPSLSGGEGQRIRLASQIGSGLVGVMYILDEPSIGLHTRDHRALLDTLVHLRDQGNTVMIVEHDADTMREADWIIDLGPGPGVLGGKLVASGTPEDIMADPDSLTGRYLSGELRVTSPNEKQRRNPQGWLTIRKARLNNLKNIDARFPLGTFTCVTGVSGSGKSSLISHTLFPALSRILHNAQSVPGPHDGIDGLEQIDKIINITQDPIGRNPRSNPGTYAGVLDEIRKVFAQTNEAKGLGYNAGRFSFNQKGGRCEACAGYGYKKVEMHFLADVWVKCRECQGRRFNQQTLAITYKDKNIADVMDMDVQEALSFFAHHSQIMRILQTLQGVGLDYIKLGQSALTLSGGEAQRVKLAKELSRAATGRTVYILDEPTTGLHFADIQRLLDVLHQLVAVGNTIIVIEHNLDVIRTADWVLDLGLEGGEKGGWIVAEGTPENLAQSPLSHTGRYLRGVL